MKSKVPPLALCLILAGLMYLASCYTWSYGEFRIQRYIFSVLAVLVSVLFVVLGAMLFKRAKTTVNPIRPENTSTLVTTGIYAVSRNPMYFGFALGLLAWAVFLGNVFSLLFVIAFTAYMHCVQIPTEERVLTEIFGAQYERYTNSVRRWI